MATGIAPNDLMDTDLEMLELMVAEVNRRRGESHS